MSNATFYRCWKCSGPLPMDPRSYHRCPASVVPSTGVLDRLGALESRVMTLEGQVEFLTRELQKGFVGVKRFSDGTPVFTRVAPTD